MRSVPQATLLGMHSFFSLFYGKRNPPTTGRQNPPTTREQDPPATGEQDPPTTGDQCVFIRGFRAKRVFFWTKPIRAGAEPLPDDPNNRRDDEIQVTRIPGVLKVSNLPIVG